MSFSNPSARAIAGGTIFTTLVVALAGCSGSSEGAGGGSEELTTGDPGAPELSSVSVATYRQGSAAPMLVPEDVEGVDRFGLDISTEWVESSAAGTALVLGGDAQFAYSSFWGVVDATVQGLDLVIVTEMMRFPPGQLTLEALPGSGIETAEDLEGKTVAVPALNGAQHNRLQYLFHEEGYDIDSVEIVELPMGEVPAALANGTIDAGSVAGPPLNQVKTEQESVTVVDFADGLYRDAAEGGIVATREFVEENPNTVAAFQCAWASGVEAIEDDEVYKQVLIDALGFSPEVAEDDLGNKPIFQVGADAEALQEFPDIMQTVGVLDEDVDMASLIVPMPDSCTT